MALTVGDSVGLYRIMDQLGQGGMATVYKAYHPNLDRYVAIKVLHPAFKEDPGFLERFKREAQIVARLEHPNIVPVYDYADYEGQPYLVMKFIEGQTLKARLKQQPLTLDEAFHILEPVADALTYAHGQGILHRDIKPSNIMLDLHGTPYIADFGLARIAQAGESTLSQDMMLGTPQYISPEQAKGVRDLGPGTDIYSLGVVLYEIVVGHVPYNADTPYAIIHDHIYKPLPLTSKVKARVPVEVERVLLRALAKEPEARYATAVDMIAAFGQAAQGEAVSVQSAPRHQPQDAAAWPSAATAPRDPLSPPMPAYTATPGPVTPSSDNRVSGESTARRVNLRILGGVGALLVVGMVGLLIILNVISGPWSIHDKAGAAPEKNATQDPFDRPLDMTIEEAQSMVDSSPNDPAAYLYLALAQMKAGERDAAFTNVAYAVRELNAPGDLIAGAARRAAASGNQEAAIWLYLEAIVREPVSPEVRNEAGAFLFDSVSNSPLVARTLINQFLERRSQAAQIYTLQALVLLRTERDPLHRQVAASINTALGLNDGLAEAYLARGLYHREIGQMDNARADWQQALGFQDAPIWVVREARSLLKEVGSS
jgi:serine/threonine protein kinase/Tfp pilus assembly protein PilF